MRFDELAKRAGRDVRDSSSKVPQADIAAVRRARRRQSGFLALLFVFAVTIVVFGAVMFWPVDEQPDLAAPVPVAPSTTLVTSEGSPIVSSLPVDRSLPLTIVAVRPNNPSFVVLDFEESTSTLYGPSVHSLPGDATDGVAITPDRDTIIWSNGRAHLFISGLDEPGLPLGSPPREISGLAPGLRVVPTPDGERVWLVQPGVGYGDNDFPTLIELVELESGEVLLTTASDPNSFPVGATSSGLVLGTHSWLDTGDGFVVEAGSEVVLHVDESGNERVIGPGIPIAASPSSILMLVCSSDDAECDRGGELTTFDHDGNPGLIVERPAGGVWQTVGGPAIPSESMPLPAVSPDGAKLVMSIGVDPDENGVPTSSRLVVIDLATGSTREVAAFDDVGFPLATWSGDGEWIVLIDGNDLQLVDAEEPATTLDLPDAFPIDHFALSAG